jgi:hypothetical protein
MHTRLILKPYPFWLNLLLVVLLILISALWMVSSGLMVKYGWVLFLLFSKGSFKLFILVPWVVIPGHLPHFTESGNCFTGLI